MLGPPMESIVITLQLLLLLPSLPLAVMSHRTSRGQRARHQGYLAVACLLGLLTLMLAMVSLAIVFSDEPSTDPLLNFAPPMLTLLACMAVVRRGLAAATSRRRR